MNGTLDTQAMVNLTLEEVETLSRRVLEHHGLTATDAAAVSRTIVAGQRDDCQSHGLYRLLVCAHTLRTGKVVKNAAPVITSPSSAVVRADARGGYAQPAFEAALPLFVEKARVNGLAAMALTDCVHFSALWPEVEAVVAHGLVVLCCTPSHAWVAPAGGTRPLLGTNPLAFGWPRPGDNPFVFDFATSAVARGEIELHRRAGLEIPDGWGIDADGAPTNDAAAALAGAMLTFGSHKGSALSLMIELIAGPLIGDMTSAESMALDAGAGASPRGGVLFLALDPAGFLGEAAAQHLVRAEKLFDAVTTMGARLPSERRFAARARAALEGVTVAKGVYEEILGLLG